MKQILALSVVLLTQVSFASDQPDQTRVEIKPVHEAICSTEGERENHQLLNHIGHIESFEDLEKIEVHFLTNEGRCKDGEYVKYRNDSTAHVQSLAQSWDWTQDPKVKYQLVDETDIAVQMKFKKSKLFKKTNERKFRLEFFPSTEPPLQYRRFYLWDVTLTKKSETSTEIKVDIQR